MQNPAFKSPRLAWLVPGLFTFALALLAGFSTVYWALKISGQAPQSGPLAAELQSSKAMPVNVLTVARALGGGVAAKAPVPVLAAAPAPPPAANRFILTGVLANRAQGGAALISVDGSPARPYRVGSSVDGTLLLQSVSSRSAVLASSSSAAAEIVLQLPALKP